MLFQKESFFNFIFKKWLFILLFNIKVINLRHNNKPKE